MRTKVTKGKIARIILLSVVSVILILNYMTSRSLIVGIPASLMFLSISSVATGEIFFYGEKRVEKCVLGLAAFVVIMALLGTFLILLVRFTEILSLVSLVIAGFALCIASLFEESEEVEAESAQVEEGRIADWKSHLLVLPFLLSVAVGFYGLVLARTGEGQVSVWLTIPSFFLSVFFISSFLLVTILFFTKTNVGVKLALISLYSLLAHSVFLLVWYPGRYGDPWMYLGNARFIDSTGTFYAYEWLYSQRLIADLVKYQGYYGLVVIFRRIFSLDIYWIHTSLMPLLWSLFTPALSYKLAESISPSENKTLPLLTSISAGLFSGIIYWGAISHTFSLGLLFLFFSVTLLLQWLEFRRKRILVLSIVAILGTVFSHPITGVFALIFLGVILIRQALPRGLQISFFLLACATYPFVSLLQGGEFALDGLLNLENLLSFQLDMATVLFVFGFLGLLFSINRKIVKSRIAIILFLFYVSTAISYYVSMYGMENSIAPDRLPFIMDVLLLPFVALGLMITANFLKDGFSRLNTYPLKRVLSAHVASMLIISLLLSLQLTLALFQAYPHDEVTDVQPAAYELEALLYIDSNASGRYVVLGDTNFASIAGGFLGIDYCYGTNPRGVFGMPEWDWWTMKLYLQMTATPSLSIMEAALSNTAANVSYFVVSVREGNYFEDIVQRTSEVLAVDRVFGGGQLYVFKYPSEENPRGPTVKVVYEDGNSTEVYARSEYSDWSEVNYTIQLWGHSTYNISDYPRHWTFLSLTVNDEEKQFDNSSDVNAFIYISNLDPDWDELKVTWRGNNLYPNVGWKDDSFKRGWQARPDYGSVSPNITSDGNVLSLSWNFTPGEYQYYYHMKSVSVSTNDYPFMFVKWRSTGPMAYVTISYSPEGEAAIVPINSESDGWSVAKVKLWPDVASEFVTVGITNYNDKDIAGPQTLYIDYILICGEA